MNIRKFLTTGLMAALTVQCVPALAGNTMEDHHTLWTTVEAAGIEIFVNDPEHCDTWGGGFYASNSATGWGAIMICQDNGKDVGAGNQVDWTANDLDTLRHESHHVLQDCLEGGLADGRSVLLFSDSDEFMDFITRVLPESKIEFIWEAYGRMGSSDETRLMELEAFAIAAGVDASKIAEGITKLCPMP